MRTRSFDLALRDKCSTENVRVSFVGINKENPDKSAGTSALRGELPVNDVNDYFFDRFLPDVRDNSALVILCLLDQDGVVSWMC